MEDKISILLVDDDEEDYLITLDLLEEIKYQQYELDWIDNYRQAQAVIRRQEHDVYLVDFRLGAENGLELIRDALAAGSQAPMILLTGQGDFETDARAMRIGASDYLIKSQLTAAQLERSIRYGIEQARNLREIRQLNADLEARVERRTQALRLAVEDLRESQQLYRSLAKSYPNGTIMVLDRELRYVFIDGQELQRFRYKPEELVGKHITAYTQASQIPVLEYYLHRVFEGESLSFELVIESQIYQMRGVPLPNPFGEVTQILLVSNNVTKQKEAEQEMRNALKKEQDLNEMKSRFISLASHEFRTPLSTIMSSVSLISRYTQTEDQAKREKHIERIKTSVRNLTGILEDFLSISRLEEGKIDARPTWFDAVALCREVADEMQMVAKPGQKIVFAHSGEPELYLDKHLFRNILLNLLSNAVKYSPDHKSIWLDIAVGPDHTTLTVKDEGIGIPEDEQIHLFERFYRANNATNIQGTGLGLNIVHKYVSLMGGQINFESKLDTGSTFWVTFPHPDPNPATAVADTENGAAVGLE
ncbi:MAG: hypothetical protein OHK0039_21710 [Bacteroidia bacterium]